MHENAIHAARRILHHHTDLLRTERSCVADLLLSIAEFEERGLHRALGHATLFDYLHRSLSMSKGMAHYRMVGARLIRRFAEVEGPVRDGRLCLTTVVELARVMTEENRSEVLPRFFGLSRQEARQVAVELDPVAVVPRRTIVSTPVPVTVGVEVQDRPSGPGSTVEPELTRPEGMKSACDARPDPLPGTVRSMVVPMTATESRLHITVSREFLALLRRAKAGESHRNPDATDEKVLKLALETLLEKQSKRKACVPARVKREVVKRDEGKCQWKLADGGVCGSTVKLEVDHVVPRGKGGPDTVDNCRILCKGHNLEAARRAYGDEVMDLFTQGGTNGRGATAGERVARYGRLSGRGHAWAPHGRSPWRGVSLAPE